MRLDLDYKDMTDKQKAFVRELAEEDAGHSLTPGGIQFWIDLKREEVGYGPLQDKQ